MECAKVMCRHILRTVILLVSYTLMSFAAHGELERKKVHFTSLEWPPYSGAQLRGQGASVAVARAAFDVMGYELHVDFYPWARAVGLAKVKDSRYHGYFPEYYSAEVETEFLFSDVIGSGPLGFIEQPVNPITWTTLDDLFKYRIGVVRGYVNTSEFDTRIADGRIRAEPVVADIDNIKKVVAERLDLAVIDVNVLDYLMNNSPELKGLKGRAVFNARLLEQKDLFLCFKNTEEGQELRAIFNQGLKKINVDAIMKDYLNQ